MKNKGTYFLEYWFFHSGKLVLLWLALLLPALGIAQEHSAKRHKLAAKVGFRLSQLLFAKDSSSNRKWPSAHLIKTYGIQKQGTEYLVPLWLDITPGTELPVGVQSHQKLGNLQSAMVPYTQLEEVLSAPQITQAEACNRMQPTMVLEREDTRATAVHAGAGLPNDYIGRNTVILTLDAGFQFDHPTLLDTSGTATRVVSVWDQTRRIGTPPVGYSYGVEFTTPAAIAAAKLDSFIITHGAHTAGISGGSGFGTNGMYRGMAPAAQHILVPTDFWDYKLVDAIVYGHAKATQLGKRMVVNMSFGGWGGPMDGTDPFSRALDSLSLVLQPAPIFVASMGNEGGIPTYVEHSFASATDTFKTVLDFTARDNTFFGEPQPEFYSEQPFQIRVSFIDTLGQVVQQYPWYNTARTRPYFLEPRWRLNGDSTHIGMVLDSHYVSNGQNHALVHHKAWAFNHYVRIELVGSAGQKIWGWSTFQRYANSPGRNRPPLPGHTGGLLKNNYRLPGGTAKTVISVGAHITRKSFLNAGGTLINSPVPDTTLGQITEFGGRGPGLNGALFGSRPTVTAPGRLVLSALSDAPGNWSGNLERTTTLNGNTYQWGGLSGTSMSAPMVTGAVALLLEARPNLTQEEVMRIIGSSARKDAFTGPLTVQSPDWGFGKLDVLNAIQQAQTILSTQVAVASRQVVVYPNPAHGNAVLQHNLQENFSLRVYSAQGQIIHAETVQAHSTQEGENSALSLPASKWPSGVYMVVIRTSQAVRSMRLVVR